MYKGCESAMGLLINLKVSDDEKEFTDLLKKTFSSALVSRVACSSPPSWSSCSTHCCCWWCWSTRWRCCGGCCVASHCCTGCCCYIVAPCCTERCYVVESGEVFEVLDCLEHWHDHSPWNVVVIRIFFIVTKNRKHQNCIILISIRLVIGENIRLTIVVWSPPLFWQINS